jgi:hypothetical protein
LRILKTSPLFLPNGIQKDSTSTARPHRRAPHWQSAIVGDRRGLRHASQINGLHKGDEAWTFMQVQAFWRTHDLLLIGMASGVGLPNSGMSFWVFLAISSILPTNDPLALTRAVQLMNVIAILLLAIFALKGVERSEREPWLWSVALVSVNPLAVLFSPYCRRNIVHSENDTNGDVATNLEILKCKKLPRQKPTMNSPTNGFWVILPERV